MEIKTQIHRNSQNHDARSGTLTWALIQREFRSPDPNRVSISSTNNQNSKYSKFDVTECGVDGSVNWEDESGLASMSPRNILDLPRHVIGFLSPYRDFFSAKFPLLCLLDAT